MAVTTDHKVLDGNRYLHTHKHTLTHTHTLVFTSLSVHTSKGTQTNWHILYTATKIHFKMYVGGTGLTSESWKVKNGTKNASQNLFFFFLKDIWILKSSCSLKSPTHALIWCPFHPCVTAVARKRPQSFCQKYRWQVTPKHTYALDPSKSERADYAAVQA